MKQIQLTIIICLLVKAQIIDKPISRIFHGSITPLRRNKHAIHYLAKTGCICFDTDIRTDDEKRNLGFVYSNIQGEVFFRICIALHSLEKNIWKRIQRTHCSVLILGGVSV